MPSPEPRRLVTDAELVEKAGRGDAPAQEALYMRYVQRGYGLAVRLLGNRADAEDVAQESFVAAFKGLSRLRSPELFGRWFSSIVVRKCNREITRRVLLRRLGISSTSPLELDDIAAKNAPAETRQELQELLEAMQAWPAGARVAYCLQQLEGMSVEEIGAVTGWSRATVNRRLMEARTRLEQMRAKGPSHA